MVLNKYRINLITAALLLISNAAMFILDNSHTIDRYVSLSIPIIAFIFLGIYREKSIYPFYTIVAVLTTIFGTTDNPSGAIFFFMSMYDKRTNKNVYFNIVLMVLSLCIKAYIIEYFIAHIFSLIIAFFFIIGHMYVRFWPIADIREHKELTPKGFTIEQADTITTLLKDLRHQESADELRIGRKAYTARVSALRDRYNITTDFMLALKLVEDEIININDLANANLTEKK